MEIQTTITFKNPDVVSEFETLWIEAKGWENDPNQVSFADLYKLIGTQVINLSIVDNPFDLAFVQPPTHDCGITEGQIKNTIYVYRVNTALSYSLQHSYGSLGHLGSKQSEEVSFEEIFNFNIDKKAALSYPHTGNVNASWQGVVYDSVGNIISPPSYSLNGSTINLDQEVYGALKVVYTLYRDTYELTLDPGEESDLFGGAVYAVYTGGISWLELDSPVGITQALLDGDVECGYQWGNLTFDFSKLVELDPNIPSEAPKVDTKITIDYCSQEVQSVEQTYV